jgi:NADH-quinone oxidoreductase subunit F
MAEFEAQVLVCSNSEGAEDRRHCGDKAGAEVRQKFNQLLVRHRLQDRVTICDVGCTGQHRACDTTQGSITVYGPASSQGGVWYIVSPDDVEEIITEHLINGRVVERLRNEERSVKLS